MNLFAILVYANVNVINYECDECDVGELFRLNKL